MKEPRKTVTMNDGSRVPKAQIEWYSAVFLTCPYCGGLCEAGEWGIETTADEWPEHIEHPAYENLLSCLECGQKIAWPKNPFRHK